MVHHRATGATADNPHKKPRRGAADSKKRQHPPKRLIYDGGKEGTQRARGRTDPLGQAPDGKLDVVRDRSSELWRALQERVRVGHEAVHRTYAVIGLQLRQAVLAGSARAATSELPVVESALRVVARALHAHEVDGAEADREALFTNPAQTLYADKPPLRPTKMRSILREEAKKITVAISEHLVRVVQKQLRKVVKEACRAEDSEGKFRGTRERLGLGADRSLGPYFNSIVLHFWMGHTEDNGRLPPFLQHHRHELVVEGADYTNARTDKYKHNRHTTGYFLKLSEYFVRGQALLIRLCQFFVDLTGRTALYGPLPERTSLVPRFIRITAQAIGEVATRADKQLVESQCAELLDEHGQPGNIKSYWYADQRVAYIWFSLVFDLRHPVFRHRGEHRPPANFEGDLSTWVSPLLLPEHALEGTQPVHSFEIDGGRSVRAFRYVVTARAAGSTFEKWTDANADTHSIHSRATDEQLHEVVHEGKRKPAGVDPGTKGWEVVGEDPVTGLNVSLTLSFRQLHVGVSEEAEHLGRLRQQHVDPNDLASPTIAEQEGALGAFNHNTLDPAEFAQLSRARHDVRLRGGRVYAAPSARSRRWQANVSARRRKAAAAHALIGRYGKDTVFVVGDWLKDKGGRKSKRGRRAALGIGLMREIRRQGVACVLGREAKTSMLCSRLWMRKGGVLRRCGGTVEYNWLTTSKLVWRGAARGLGFREVWAISRCTDPSCRTIYQRDFNAARNIYLNALDAVARVLGRPTTADLCYECDTSQLPDDFDTE